MNGIERIATMAQPFLIVVFYPLMSVESHTNRV